jgi:hypothetical protein
MKTPTTVIRGKHVEIRVALLFSIEVIWTGLRIFLNQSSTIYISQQMTSKHIKHLDMSEAIKVRSDQFHAN